MTFITHPEEITVKTKLAAFIYFCYAIFIYWSIWVKVDNPADVQRLSYYHGNIEVLDCQTYKGHRKEREEVYIELDSGEKIEFVFPNNKGCKVLFDTFNSISKVFDGYFIGGTIMQLNIGNRELVNFNEEKEKMNIFAFYLILSPLVIWFLGKVWKSRKGIQKAIHSGVDKLGG